MWSAIHSLALVVAAPAQAEIAQAPAAPAMSGKELVDALVGKKLSRRARDWVSGHDAAKASRTPGAITVTFYFRTDGSFQRRCVSHDHEGRGCDGRYNVGVWRLEGERMCISGARHDPRQAWCFSAIRHSPTALHLRWQPIPPAMDGPWTLGDP